MFNNPVRRSQPKSMETEPVSNTCKRRNFAKCCGLGILLLVLMQFMINYISISSYYSFLSIWMHLEIYADNASFSLMNNSRHTMLNITLPPCPEVPPHLNGSLATFKEFPPFEELEKLLPEIEAGGRFRPVNCVSRHRVAIIIPYRDREKHLRNLLYNLHAMLERQQIDYGIFVVEEALPTKFNRAMLMNIGYNEAIKTYDYRCFIFHDVDHIPEDDRLLYNCPTQPRHMSAAVEKFSYKLPYYTFFGGVSSLTKEQFIKVNGFSNIYFGWGGEDDDMYERIIKNGYKVIRYPMEIARYRTIKHKRDKGNADNPKRMVYLRNARNRSRSEGLTTLKYKVLNVDRKRLYTWILVQINETEIMKGWKK